jgi:hypothetical protein
VFFASEEAEPGGFSWLVSHSGLGGGFLPPASLGRYPRVSSGMRILRAVAIVSVYAFKELDGFNVLPIQPHAGSVRVRF